MPRFHLSPAAKAELASCCEAGLTTHQTRLRLTLRGVTAAERSVCRWMADYRRSQDRVREAAAAEERQVRYWEAVGRGLGSVHLSAAPATKILQTAIPGWRERQAVSLADLLRQFLAHPSGELYAGLAVGLHAFLLSSALSEVAGEKLDA